MLSEFINLLDDPHYWNPDRPYERTEVDMKYATLMMAIVCFTLVAITVVVYKASDSNNNKWLKEEKTCLTMGGQWIKNDCVNNIINLGPPGGSVNG